MSSAVALFEKIDSHFSQRLPFVVYNKPNSGSIVGIFQQDDALHFVKDYNEKGFVFAPFEGNQIILIPENQSKILTTSFEKIPDEPAVSDWNENEVVANKAAFVNLVQKAIDAIRSGTFGKVVLSRKETVSLTHFDLKAVFQKLVQSYPTAFTYCFFHPKTGLWLGAFSEQLLQVKNKDFKTMAVAGTQKFEENKAVVWEPKEKAEQQFVTDFILENIKEHVSGSTVSEPYTMKAGNLVHIKTDIEGVLNEPSHLKEVLSILHPTPAVCGFPKGIAKDFILKNEGYDRKYYAGFLGEFNHNFEKGSNATELYVNLRCMQIETDKETVQANLYVGGGITKDSIAENEWMETVNKSKTMKKVLK